MFLMQLKTLPDCQERKCKQRIPHRYATKNGKAAENHHHTIPLCTWNRGEQEALIRKLSTIMEAHEITSFVESFNFSYVWQLCLEGNPSSTKKKKQALSY